MHPRREDFSSGLARSDIFLIVDSGEAGVPAARGFRVVGWDAITRRVACCKAEDGHHEYDFSSGLQQSDIFLIVECGEADHAPSRLRQG